MNIEVRKMLKDNGVELELKGYQESPASDGYYMRGNLYVNGKKAMLFEEVGNGTECDCQILNKTNAMPLLELEEEVNKIKTTHYGRVHSYKLVDIFYQLANDDEYKKKAKKTHYSKWTVQNIARTDSSKAL